MRNLPQRLPRLPAFAVTAGLTVQDLAARDGEIVAEGGVLRATERDARGVITGVETMKGPREYWFTRGGRRGLHAAPRTGFRHRLVLTAGAFEALCCSAVDGHRTDTVYASVPGRATWPAENALLCLICDTGITDVVLAPKVSRLGLLLADELQEAIEVTFTHLTCTRMLPRSTWADELVALRTKDHAA